MIVFLLFFLFGLENCCGIVCVKGEFCIVVDFKLEILLFVKDLVVDFFLFFLFGFENFVIEFFLEDKVFEFIDDEDCVIDEKLFLVCEILLFVIDLGFDFFLFFLFGFENFVIEFFLKDILFEFIDDEDMDEKLLFVCLVLFFLLGLEVIEIIL